MQKSQERSIVHIGFHKTGSTSIQKFLWRFRPRFADLGIAIYEGQHIRDNHVELHIAAMDQERMSPFKHSSGVSGGEAYRRKVERRLQSFAAATAQSSYLFSAEGLSYLRDRDELEWLKSALPGEITIVAYLRNRDDYVSAYRYMLQNNKLKSRRNWRA